MILVLGAGWTGTKICLRNPSKFVATTRSSEKLEKLTSMGLNATLFDLLKEETWQNLPPKSEVDGTIFTFDILESQLPHLQLLWDKHITKDKPVLCLGTISVFYHRRGDLRALVDETAPLTGLSLVGKSLDDRVNGEEWALSKGATVLHLSGICSDEEEEDRYPIPDGLLTPYSTRRTIKGFLAKGYMKNGLQLINFIHINDIYKVCMLLIEKTATTRAVDNVHPIKGQRIITSCGTFRINELQQGCNLDALPEIIPPDDTFSRSKTLSIAKLFSLLPEDYEWTLPVAGVEPVSRGLPTTGVQAYAADGAAHDRQWRLMTLWFEGKWQGKSVWYKRDKGQEKGGKLDHQAYIAEMKAPTLPDPVLVIEKTEYHLYCLDADTLVWHGKGLVFAKDGEKKIRTTRKTFNSTGNCLIFPGMGGQVAPRTVDVDRFGIEANFFHERSRSMIIALYTTDSNILLLDLISITPFRCGLGCSFPLKPSQNENRGNIKDLVSSLQGKTCHRQWMSYTRALDETNGGEVCEYPTSITEMFFDPDRVVQLFDDDLVCSLPPSIKPGDKCELVMGCFHTTDYAQIVMVTYGSDGKLQKNVLEKWT